MPGLENVQLVVLKQDKIGEQLPMLGDHV